MPVEFKPFPKMARLSRECIITEKLDGTNASILIDGGYNHRPAGNLHTRTAHDGFVMYAGSRNRQLTLHEDNYGFAKWVQENSEELVKLGPGQHFGEFWGAGIQRRYGLSEKRFSLFNASRWHRDLLNGGVFEEMPDDTSRRGPLCCSVVPVLYQGNFSTGMIEARLTHLEAFGSVAAPGFRDPEGIVIYHTAAGICFKKTLKNDESPKSLI